MSICLVCKQEFTPKRREQKLCSISCRQQNNARGRHGQKTGPQSKQYKSRMTKDGYLIMYAGKHPYANGRKSIHVHVMVMEMHIGRSIHPQECVHHINGNKTDNQLENLELMTTDRHSRAHNLALTKTRNRAGGRYA
jgi:uncharacterized Zn-finger protein